MTLTVGSLFSGIGGLDLGLERAGMEVRWQIENNAYCQRVLAKHWPAVPRYGDIKEVDPSELESVDVICGGFPCQPVSLAGKGRAQDDERWLWPEFVRVVRHLRPHYVLVENVPGLLVRGMGDVLGALAGLGYDAEWQSIPATAVGAPHLRYRVLVVAYASSEPVGPEQVGQHWGGGPSVAGHDGVHGPVADASGGGGEDQPVRSDSSALPVSPELGAGHRAASGGAPEGAELTGRGTGVVAQAVAHAECSRHRPEVLGEEAGRTFAFGSAGRAGGSGWWEVEPNVGRVAHGVPHRLDRLRALGNAVVPQVAEWVGRQIVVADARRQAA
jgi:DNA (cytosine-5)-methyltransferase 1